MRLSTVVGRVLIFCMASTLAKGQSIKVLASFNGSNGALPFSELTADANGNLFGTTSYGGASNFGTVFELSPTFSSGSYSITTLTSFPGGTKGMYPFSALTPDGLGNLYGTTNSGGFNGTMSPGTIFKVSTSSNVVIQQAAFSGADGFNIVAGLTLGPKGTFYGVAQHGGALGYGAVYQFDPSNNTITDVYSFDFTKMGGSYPIANLILGSDGNLYGTTQGGSNPGIIFKINPNSHAFQTLYVFPGMDGGSPNGVEPLGLTEGHGGDLYGITRSGGDFGLGTAFKYSASTSTFTQLASFDGTNGSTPLGRLLADSDGNFYGTTTAGGAYGKGNVFELSGTTGSITTLVSFDGTNGSSPADGVIADADGNLFGTADDAITGNGVVFEVLIPEPSSTIVIGAIGIVSLMRRRRTERI